MPCTGPDSLNLYTNSVFYPGQRVVAGDASVFRAARWVKGYWKPSHGGQGTVSKVETAAVLVYWVASSRLGTDTSLVQASAPPPHQQCPRDLTFFCSGDAGVWAVVDHLRAGVRGPHGPAPGGDGGSERDAVPRRALHLQPSATAVVPATPPLVNYRSFGLRVNPNLYPSGTVCLSFLNTFGGHGTELWSPDSSTVLQVVVSIHGLVLNAQPYYNEAGYDVQGCHVGTLDDAAEGMSRERRPCSTGFRLALLNVVPRLVEAFAGVGVQGLRPQPLALQVTTQ
nr:unnamed protein product [Digitaria exilis]